jgi:hypothetical protein
MTSAAACRGNVQCDGVPDAGDGGCTDANSSALMLPSV